MHKDRTRATFLSRWTRRRAAVRHDDPADLGTAFGLDLSVAARSEEPSVGVPAPEPTRWWARWRHRAG